MNESEIARDAECATRQFLALYEAKPAPDSGAAGTQTQERN
jgi:hypothetical protein